MACSPWGHKELDSQAGKEGPHLAMTGGLMCFLRLRRRWGPPHHERGDLTSLAPHTMLPEILVVSRACAAPAGGAGGAEGASAGPGDSGIGGGGLENGGILLLGCPVTPSQHAKIIQSACREKHDIYGKRQPSEKESSSLIYFTLTSKYENVPYPLNQ